MAKLWKVVNDSNRQLYVGTMEECRYYIREKKCLTYTHIVPKDTPILTYEVINTLSRKKEFVGSAEECKEYVERNELSKCLVTMPIGMFDISFQHTKSTLANKPHTDPINPHHYQQGKIECIDAIESATTGKTGFEGALVANIIKYLWRYEEKNGLEDVKKTQWYINKLIQAVQEREENND